MNAIEFVKMQGTGNDFILIDARRARISNPSKLAVDLCRRHFSVGADGLLLVLDSNVADYKMRIFNPDGSEAEMCGNGIRCFARYLQQEEGVGGVITVETRAGIIRPKIGKDITVDMGKPVPGESRNLDINGDKITVTEVSMGNPHAVVFVEDVKNYPVEQVGREIENHPSFPNRTNVEFVAAGKRELNVRVWERGVGETLACGTGACAALVASVLNGRSAERARVNLPGGSLTVEWRDHVFLSGPAERVFDGVIRWR